MTRRMWLFAGVGVAGFALQSGVLAGLTAGLGVAPVPGTALAVELAVLHNFAWHERITWADRTARDPGGLWRRLRRFHASNGLVSLVGNVGLTAVLARVSGLPLLAANAIAVGACTALNFVAADRMVFDGGEEADA